MPTTLRSGILRFALRLVAIMAAVAVVTFSAPVASAKQPAKTASKSTAKPAPKKAAPAKPSRGSGDVRKEKQRTEKEIADTKKKISDNERKISGQLDHLSNLESQIERQEATIETLLSTIDELNLRADALRDSIAEIQSSDSILGLNVARSLRQRHVQKSRLSSIAFVMGSTSMREALQKLNYLNVNQKAHSRRINRLRAHRRELESRKSELDSVVAKHSSAVKQLSTAKSILDSRRRESQRVVSDLRSRSESLKKVLEDKNRRIRQLNDELERIIAEEQRRAAEEQRKASGKKNQSSKPGADKTVSGQTGNAAANRKLTGSFASNKGKLLFPVAGKYTIVGSFGRSKHKELSHVQMDNTGIDIAVAAGTKARAVFQGTVSSVFFMDGYENIIIVRHGEYLTVYAGLSKINVSKGERVNSGQTLGTIATLDGKTVLHFEVRKERTKLNPLQWVK